MTIQAPKFVPVGKLELVFQPGCECECNNEVTWAPEDLVDNGTPVCGECGEDYQYTGALVYEITEESPEGVSHHV